MLFVIMLFFISRLLVIVGLPFLQALSNFFGFTLDKITWEGVDNLFLKNWTAFDSEFYLNISQKGYFSEESTAFFPLYPVLIRALSLIGINPAWSGFLISLISFFIGLIFLFKILKLEGLDNYSLLLVVFSPITAFFMAVYTESLFFCLSTMAFYYMIKKKWVLSGIVIGFASLTRNSGAILFLCLAIEMWKSKENIKSYIKDIFFNSILGVLIASIYPIYLWFAFGNPIKFATIQSEFWHRHFTLPFVTIYNEVINIINYPSVYFISIINLVFLGIVMWMVFNYKRIRNSYLVFVVLSTFMPLFSPPYWNNIPYTTGLTRYILVMFPIYMFLSQKIKSKLFRIIFLEIWIGLTIMLLTAFIGKQFIG